MVLKKLNFCRGLALLAAAALLLAVVAGGAVAGEDESEVERIYGEDRYETAANIAERAYDQADTVIIARGDSEGGYADGLTGSLLAGAMDAPILLTNPGYLPDATAEAVDGLDAAKVVILGGENAVSVEVEEALGMETRRIAGESREETAVRIAKEAAEVAGAADTAFIVSGYAPADSLSAGPLAAADGIPILQVRQDSIPGETGGVIEEMGFEDLVVVGGPEVVSEDVYSELSGMADVQRISGDNRYATSAAVAEELFEEPDHVIFAAGPDERLADAMAGGYLGAIYNAPLLYLSDGIPGEVEASLPEIVNPETRAFLLGGTAAVPEALAGQVASLVREMKDEHVVEEKPIIFVHGGAGSAEQFETQAKRFASNDYQEDIEVLEYCTFRWESDEYKGEVIARLAGLIEEVLEESEADRVNLVGHSRGTTVSGLFFEAFPEQHQNVARYVGLDGAGVQEAVVPSLGVWSGWSMARGEPEIAGGENVYFQEMGHTEVPTSEETFAEMYSFITGEEPQTTKILPEEDITVEGRVNIHPENLFDEEGTLKIFEVDGETGHRIEEEPVETLPVGPPDGSWVFEEAEPNTHYEFVLEREGKRPHHFYREPFVRSNHFVRLNTSRQEDPGEIGEIAEPGDGHTNLNIVRQREFFGDREDSDVLEINGINVINENIQNFVNQTIAMFVVDWGADGESDLTQPIEAYHDIIFFTGVNYHIPAADPPEDPEEDTVSLELTPRGYEDVTQSINIPNWPSSGHRVTVQFKDYTSEDVER